jgi:hypothetical protein
LANGAGWWAHLVAKVITRGESDEQFEN